MNSFNPIFTQELVNDVTLKRVTVNRLQSELFVFTIEFNKVRYKIFQIFFTNSDGPLNVNFPYFALNEGIVASASYSLFLPKEEVKLEESGKTTSKKVKFAYHPDGRANFPKINKLRLKLQKWGFLYQSILVISLRFTFTI